MTRPYSYATLADVEAMIPGFRAATSSKPTASQVAGHIANIANEIDATLAVLDYATPVPTVATASMEILRSYVTVGAAYRTAMAMPQGKESKHADEYGKEWRAILSGLTAGQRQLPDAPKSSSTRTRARGGGGDPCDSPTFTRDSTFTQR